MRKVTSRHLAWLTAALSATAAAAGTTLNVLFLVSTADYSPLVSHQALVPILTVIYAGLGVLVASRHPKNPIGWIFAVVALLTGLNALSIGVQNYGSIAAPGRALAGVELARWASTWIWIPEGVLPMTFVLLLFPTGRLLTARWSIVAWPLALGLAALLAGVMFHPGPMPSLDLEGPNPYGFAGAAGLMNGLIQLGSLGVAVGLLGSMASLLVRFRRSAGVERAQLKWLAYALGLMVVGFILQAVITTLWPDVPAVEELSIAMTSLMVLGIAAASSVAILRHRLYDIDIIINRTLVYGVLTGTVVGGYVIVVGGLGILLQSRSTVLISFVATGIVAILFQPLRDRLQRSVNRWMYGDRDDPYAVLARLGQRLEVVVAPDAVLPAIVETVAQALRLPYAAITLGRDDRAQPAASFGLPHGEPLSFPLVYQGEPQGRLLLSPRAQGEPFSPTEHRLLADIANQIGVAAHAVLLTEDLQRSRERLVTAQEEERRRLRRDLHDGLGPALAAITLKLDAARNLLTEEPASVEPLLAQLKRETQDAIGDIRRLVYDLRPPALDELGLAGAIREHAARAQGNGLRVAVEIPAVLPALPAAVEVAAYRIAQEALTNVIHHARAKACRVRLDVGSELVLEVTDDGVGLPAGLRAGVGLTSIRERASELGGRATIERMASGGTRVHVQLPLAPGR